jgi:disulfide bond formation protein DsbB
LLACDAFAALSLVPSVKFPPALGREAILSQRTGLYLLVVGLSVALVIGAVTVGRRIAGRLGTGNATLISAGFYVAGIAAVMWLLPPVPVVSGAAHLRQPVGPRPEWDAPTPLRGAVTY